MLRVTQQSEKHLQKVTSIDEFLRRIYSVIHSNDPVARALTLRYSGLIILGHLQTCSYVVEVVFGEMVLQQWLFCSFVFYVSILSALTLLLGKCIELWLSCI